MRKLNILMFSLLIILTFTACQQSNVDDQTSDKYTEKGKEVVELLLDGDYEAVYEQFNDEMSTLLPVSEMDELTPVIEEAGEFEEYEVTAVEERDDLFVTVTVTKHEKGKLGFTITFEEDGDIAGLFIK